VSFSIIGASSFPPGDSFGKVMDAAQYAPDLPQLHRIFLILNVYFFTFFPDTAGRFHTSSKFTLALKSGVAGTHTTLVLLAGVLQFVSTLDEMGIAVDSKDPARDAEGPGMIFLEPP